MLSSFGCSGENISPHLKWGKPPEGTKSFAITVYDKDAPTGSGFWHWVMFDIPRTITEIPAGTGGNAKSKMLNGAIQSTTSFGAKGYGGACPPVGESPHQYLFTVYALSVEKLGLDESATPELVGYNLEENVLEKASIVAYLKR